MKHMSSAFLTTKEVAERLGVSASLVKRWRSTGQGPRCVTLGFRLIRYSPADIQTYLGSLTKIPDAPAEVEEIEVSHEEYGSKQ